MSVNLQASESAFHPSTTCELIFISAYSANAIQPSTVLVLLVRTMLLRSAVVAMTTSSSTAARLTTDSLTDEWNGVQRLVQVAGAGGVTPFPKAAHLDLSTCIVRKPTRHHIGRGVTSIVIDSQDVGGLPEGAGVLSRWRLLP